jgi:hypothetical protein
MYDDIGYIQMLLEKIETNEYKIAIRIIRVAILLQSGAIQKG